MNERPQDFRKAVAEFKNTFPKKYDGLVNEILTEVELAWDIRLRNGQTEGSVEQAYVGIVKISDKIFRILLRLLIFVVF